VVRLEDVGDVAPPSSVQGLVGNNGSPLRLGVSSCILGVPVWGRASRIPRDRLVKISDVGQRVKDGPGLRVDLVYTRKAGLRSVYGVTEGPIQADETVLYADLPPGP
jgi:hypothetical protein